MTADAMSKLLEMSKRISLEKNYNRLLEGILEDTMSLANCDAGVLYLKEENFLIAKILINRTLKNNLGGDGCRINLPPIPLYEGHTCSQALLMNEVLTIGNVKDCKEPICLFTALYEFWEGYEPGPMMVTPMRSRKGELIGVLQLINSMDRKGRMVPFTADDISLVKSASSQAAVSIQNMRYLEDIKELFQSFVRVLSAAIDERIPFNATHTRNMVRYGERFIKYLNNKYKVTGRDDLFSESRKEEFLMSIWLHDIGKLITPVGILNKASRLRPKDLERIRQRFAVMRLQNRIAYLEERKSETEYRECENTIEEIEKLAIYANEAENLEDDDLKKLCCASKWYYQDVSGTEKNWFTEGEIARFSIRKGTLTDKERHIMEEHVVMTEKLLSQIRFSKEYENVPYWASMHHEYLDGSGYPKHLQDAEIPFEVRILTILDIFDAMTADDRPYKAAIPLQKTLDTLWALADKGKLDSQVLKSFEESRCWE